MKWNLLVDPCLSVDLAGGGRERISLPQVLAALEQDQISAFTHLQPHQSHPWHAFLCQLAALALEGSGLPPGQGLPPHELLGGRDADEWQELIRALTPGSDQDEPWTMVVENLGKPAFLQPPVPERSWKALPEAEEHPDDLDVLVSARSHGLKAGQESAPQIEDWTFALLSLQTNGAYMGRGNYGIARQNGGYATRPGVSLAPEGGWGGAWARDVRIMLDEGVERFLAWMPEFDPQGVKLVWLEPWQGRESEALPVSRLHPWFIEVCRRIRLEERGGGVIARRAGSKTQRIDAKALKGNLADPWIPVRRSDASAFNSRPTYNIAQQVLFDRGLYEPALLQRPSAHDRDRDGVVRFRVLVRGEGKTEGYVERSVAVPAGMSIFLDQQSDQAAEVAQAMANLASEVEYKVLKPSLVQAMQAARPAPDYKQKETSAWAGRLVRDFDQEVDRHFFSRLWPCLERYEQGEADEDFLAPWRDFLEENATAFFQQALEGLPLPGALRYKAQARAEGRFFGGMQNILHQRKGGTE